MAAALRPLRLPGFPNLGLAYLVNELGNWLGEIALAVLVFDQTGSPMATAALFCGMHFAPALLGPPLVCLDGGAAGARGTAAALRGRGGRVRDPGAARRRFRARRRARAGDHRRLARLRRAGPDPGGGRRGAGTRRPAARGKRAAQHRLHRRRRRRPGDRRPRRRGRGDRDRPARRRGLVPGRRGRARGRAAAPPGRDASREPTGPRACAAGSTTSAADPRCGGCSPPRRSPSSSSLS